MLTIIGFLLMVIGCVNWLMVGLLQYDFVAGIFGFQGSILSRIVYILIGAGCLLFVFKVIKGKGKVNIFSRRNKEDVAKNIAKMKKQEPAHSSVEASSEFLPEENHYKGEEGLLNEHLKDDE